MLANVGESLFSVFDACVMWVNIGLLYPARSSVNGLETCAIFSITHMQLKNHFRFRHFRFPAPQVVFVFALRFLMLFFRECVVIT